MTSCNFLLIGGGVIGLSIAMELKNRHRTARITMIGKDATGGEHARGNKSGGVHAGFYYSPIA